MIGNPMDMFDGMDEVDEMFARLFTRMDLKFGEFAARGHGYGIGIREENGGRDSREPAEHAAIPSSPAVEPAAEVHRIGNEVKVIVALPGITDEELRLGLKGNTLIIDAGDADHHCRTSAELPAVDRASLQKTLRNGVLEVTFTCL